MKQKITSLFVLASLLLTQTSLVFAQAPDMSAPMDTTTSTTTTESPAISEPMPREEADTVPPSFVSITTASSGETEANIVWTTNELAYGYVEYGETKNYGLSTPKSATAAMDHTVSLTNLMPGTVYHYRIVAEDEHGNVARSEDRIVETATEIVAMDNVSPEILEISISHIDTSGATVSWATNELAEGKMEYGKTAEYGSATSLSPDYATEHSATISGLLSSTEYHYRIVVRDESGNEAVSPDEVFKPTMSRLRLRLRPNRNNRRQPPPREQPTAPPHRRARRTLLRPRHLKRIRLPPLREAIHPRAQKQQRQVRHHLLFLVLRR